MDTRYNVHLALSSREYERGAEGVARGSRVAEAGLGSLDGRYKKLVATFAAAFTGYAALQFLRRIVTDSGEAQAALTRLQGIVDATGKRAGFNAQELAGFASQIQRASRYSDEAVMNAESTLLRFTNIQGEVYQRALQTVVDVAAGTGRDLETVSLGIGKSLEIPGEAMKALALAGIVLTDAQQEAITKMVEQGRTVEAQNALLAMLESRFKGAAEAASKTLGGSLDRLRNISGELFEVMGAAGVAGAVQRLAEYLTELSEDPATVEMFEELGAAIGKLLSDGIEGLIGVMPQLISFVKTLAENVDLVVLAFKLWMGYQVAQFAIEAAGGIDVLTKAVVGLDAAAAANPFGAIVMGLVAIGVALDHLIDKWGEASMAQSQVMVAQDRVMGSGISMVRELEMRTKALTVAEHERAAAVLESAMAEHERVNALIATLEAQQKALQVPSASAEDEIARADRMRETAAAMQEAQNRAQVLGATVVQLSGEMDRLGVAQERVRDSGLQPPPGVKLTAEQVKALATEFNSLVTGQQTQREKLVADMARLNELVKLGAGDAKKAAVAYERMAKELAKIDRLGSDGGVFDLRTTRKNRIEFEAMFDAVAGGQQIVGEMTDSLRQQSDHIAALRAGVEIAVKQFGKGSIEAKLMQQALQAAVDEANDLADATGSKWSNVGQVIQAAFAGVDGSLGNIGSSIGLLIEGITKLKEGAEGWQDAMAGAVNFAVAEFAPKTTQGGFGGKGATNYAAIGSIVGAIIGSFIPVIGTALGGAIGGAIGSFIVSGADEALAAIEQDSGKFVAMVTKWEGGLNTVLEDLAMGIDKSIKGLLAAIGGTIVSAAALDVKVRDGVISVFIAGVTGRFKSMDEAISFAVSELLKNSTILGLNDTIKKILAETNATSVEELTKDLDFGMWYDALGLGEVGAQLQAAMANFRVQLMKAMELNLDIGPVVRDAFKQFEGFREALLGINTSAADGIAALGSYQLGVTAVTDQLMAGLAEAQARLAEAEALKAQTAPGANYKALTEDQERLVAAIPGLRDAIQSYLAQLDAIPKALSDQEINMGIFDQLYEYLKDSPKYAGQAAAYAKMKVEIEFGLIKQQLILLGKWEEFAGMFADAYAAAMNQAATPPGRRRGGSGRADDRKSLNDELDDIIRSGLPAFTQQLLDMQDRMKQLTEDAKKLGISEDKLAAARQVLLDQLKQSLRDRAEPFLPGAGSRYDQAFKKIRDDFKQLRIDNQKLLDEESVAALTKREINQAEREALRQLGQEVLESLGVPSVETRAQMKSLGERLDFLRENAAALGIPLGQLGRITAELGLQMYTNLAEGLNKWVNDEGLKRDLEAIRFEMEIANYRLQFNLLQEMGLLTDEMVLKIEGMFEWIAEHRDDLPGGANWNPTVIAPPVYAPQSTPTTPVVDAMAEALRLLESYEEAAATAGMTEGERRLREISNDFQTIFATLGRNQRTLAAFNAALHEAFDDMLEPFRELQDELLFGDQSNLTEGEQFNLAQQQYEAALAALAGGDIGQLDTLPALIQRYLELAQDRLPMGSDAYTQLLAQMQAVIAQITSMSSMDLTPEELQALLAGTSIGGLLGITPPGGTPGSVPGSGTGSGGTGVGTGGGAAVSPEQQLLQATIDGHRAVAAEVRLLRQSNEDYLGAVRSNTLATVNQLEGVNARLSQPLIARIA